MQIGVAAAIIGNIIFVSGDDRSRLGAVCGCVQLDLHLAALRIKIKKG